MIKKFTALLVVSFIVIGGLTAFNTLSIVKPGSTAVLGSAPTLQIKSFNCTNDTYAPGVVYPAFTSCVYTSLTAEALVWTTHQGKNIAIMDEPVTGNQFLYFPDSLSSFGLIDSLASSPGVHEFNFSLIYNSYVTTHPFYVYSFANLNPTISHNQIDANMSVWMNYTGSCIGTTQWTVNNVSVGSSSHLDYKFTKTGSYLVSLAITRGNHSVIEKPFFYVVNVSSDPTVNNLSYSNLSYCSFYNQSCFTLHFSISGGTTIYCYQVYMINNYTSPVYIGGFLKGKNTYNVTINGNGPFNIQLMVNDEFLSYTSGVLYVT